MLKDQLLSAGMREKEAEVYLILLRMGKASPTELAALAGVRRTTCYDILTTLMGKGVVQQGMRGKRKIYFAEDPQKFLEVPRRQEEIIMNMMPELRSAYMSLGSRPRVRFWEGLDGMREMEMEMLERTTKEYYYFASSQVMLNTLGEDFYRKYTRERVKRGIWSNAIRMGEWDYDEYPFMAGHEDTMRRVRYFPERLNDAVPSMTITDSAVFISSGSDEGYFMSIESLELVAMMKQVWKVVWSVSSENVRKK